MTTVAGTAAVAGSPAVPATAATPAIAAVAAVAAVPAKDIPNTSFAGPATIATSDGAALLHSASIALAKGTATFQIVFSTPGAQTVTVSDAAAPAALAAVTATTSVTSSSAAAIAACGSCYATLGAGAVLQRTEFGDYTNPSNILQSTHLGAGTPQFVVGVAYKLPIQELIPKVYSKLKCSKDSFFNPDEEAKEAYCYPWKAFVSLKFSPDASQTFNGFTYGLSHALHKRLDVMFGLSFSAHNEVSPGFIAAATNTVKVQQAASNKYYAPWSLAALQGNGPTAFDGFPTQLLNADGTTGPLIYGGAPLILHYHSGFFIGVAIPVSFRNAVSGQ
jgi:hypothetical protein